MTGPRRLASLRVLAVPDRVPEEVEPFLHGDSTKGLVVMAEIGRR